MVTEYKKLKRLGVLDDVGLVSNIPDYYSKFTFTLNDENDGLADNEPAVQYANQLSDIGITPASGETRKMSLDMRVVGDTDFPGTFEVFLPGLSRDFRLQMQIIIEGPDAPEVLAIWAEEGERILPNETGSQSDSTADNRTLTYYVERAEGDSFYEAGDYINGMTWVFDGTYEADADTWWLDYGGRFYSVHIPKPFERGSINPES